MTSNSPVQNIPAGITWMVVAGLLFVAVTISVRTMGSDLPAVEAAFIRYVMGLVLLIPIFLRISWRTMRGKLLGLYAARGFFHGLGVILWFYAMARIPIADVTAIGYVTPIFTAFGAIIIFREKVHARRIIAIVVGFIGVLIILRPGFQVIELGSIAQLVAAPCFAISYLVTKKLTQTEESAVILAMLSIFVPLPCCPAH